MLIRKRNLLLQYIELLSSIIWLLFSNEEMYLWHFCCVGCGDASNGSREEGMVSVFSQDNPPSTLSTTPVLLFKIVSVCPWPATFIIDRAIALALSDTKQIIHRVPSQNHFV